MRLLHSRSLSWVITELRLIPDDFSVKHGWHEGIRGKTAVYSRWSYICQTNNYYKQWEKEGERDTSNIVWTQPRSHLWWRQRTCTSLCSRSGPRRCTWLRSARWGIVWGVPPRAPLSWSGSGRNCPARGAPASWPLRRCRRPVPRAECPPDTAEREVTYLWGR